ncbi:putative flavin reductase like domain-containing protein [Phaeoacremonium minimum UCRPA7]|uniref:Putative flavin reductase like domain-containing protein n=1 Tax=Phaeoacremonium minimum (strain UCR-PA7) TaxID=1286976 RepID=R8BH68_PHAM7|nr:putative flavin reductase like domain-containing protein [Phaeoacremonium minimum UCRPA7]EON98690.1 putative flavin reductase like domain-containing protein [Phaeoacremonium minimum UCRPA7]
MRLLTHSVVVCTARGAQDQSPRAMTMSSFTSLSLRPTPVVTFNIATPSRTLDALDETKEFNIHVLAGDASGAKVADWFRRGNAQPLHVFDHLDACDCKLDEAQGSTQYPSSVAPLLRGPGIMYVLRCKLLEEPLGGVVKVKDHVIVLGEVLEILEGQTTDEQNQERFSLMYADRRYRQLGDVMTPKA